MSLEPYVGAGLNVMVTQTDSGTDLYPESSSGFQRVVPSANANWGAMIQAGLDWRIKGYWVLNFDIRYMDNSLSMDASRPSHGGYVPAGDYRLDIKPMTYSFSFGWRW
jgi:outer membrane protein W